jgi:hypothetical protein
VRNRWLKICWVCSGLEETDSVVGGGGQSTDELDVVVDDDDDDDNYCNKVLLLTHRM